jgi:hypothetical protein
MALLIVETIALLGAAVALRRDFQDSWILEGLEFPVIALSITFMIYVFAEDKVAWIVVFALIYRLALVSLPGLKYVWFQGVAIDQHSHYELARSIFNEGYIPAGRTYSGTPLLHLSFAICSMVTNASLPNAFKFVEILYWLSYPLITYAFMKTIGPFKSSLPLKFAVVLSSIPVKSVLAYLVTGTTFGTLLAFLFLTQFTKLLQKNDRREWVVVAILGFALAMTHTYSSLILMITLFSLFLVVVPLLNKVLAKPFELKPNVRTRAVASTLTIIALANIAWYTNQATITIERGADLIILYFDKIRGAVIVSKELVPQRFFAVGFLDQLSVVLVIYGATILLMVLTVIGVVVAIKRLRTQLQSGLIFLSLFLVSLWAILAIQLLSGFSGLEFGRILMLSLVFSPIFAAVAISHVTKARAKKLVMLLIPLLMILATIELYGFQPLIPTYGRTGEPLTHVGNVNSVYQRYMIEHAERYIQEGLIACDRVTTNQIIGLTSHNFSDSHLAWYYPFSRLLHSNITEKEYDYFLIHLPGKSGPLSEKAEIRTRSLIVESVCNSSVLYSNGESYVLSEPFMYSNSSLTEPTGS